MYKRSEQVAGYLVTYGASWGDEEAAEPLVNLQVRLEKIFHMPNTSAVFIAVETTLVHIAVAYYLVLKAHTWSHRVSISFSSLYH